jgi:hypothetical protein
VDVSSVRREEFYTKVFQIFETLIKIPGAPAPGRVAYVKRYIFKA